MVWRQIPLKRAGDTTARKTCMSWYADFPPTSVLINILSPQHLRRPELLQHILFTRQQQPQHHQIPSLISLQQREINIHQLVRSRLITSVIWSQWHTKARFFTWSLVWSTKSRLLCNSPSSEYCSITQLCLHSQLQEQSLSYEKSHCWNDHTDTNPTRTAGQTLWKWDPSSTRVSSSNSHSSSNTAFLWEQNQ